jgi:hypothetical protein
MTASPGWYPDMYGPKGTLQWYDGQQWTAHTANDPRTKRLGW